VLLSDGLANSGDTSAESLVSRLREEAGKRVALLGVGVGSQYGDKLMETLADKGDGFVVYVSDRAQAKRVFVNQLPATLAIRALDAKVQVTFRPETVDTYRLVGFDNRVLASRDFRNDAVDGGEVGPGHSVTALYVVKLRPGGGQLAEARVRWQDPKSRDATEAAGTVTAGDVDRAYDAAPARLRVDCSAAFFAEVLRHHPYAQPVALDGLTRDLADLARKLEDPDVTDLATATGQATRTS